MMILDAPEQLADPAPQENNHTYSRLIYVPDFNDFIIS